MQLVSPNESHKEMWEKFNDEFIAAGEKIVPGIARSGDGTYETFLHTITSHSQSIDVPAQLVPSTTYFLLNESQNKLLGVVSIRHHLNDSLVNIGGHVGYGVAPSERRRGYATELLALALIKCREMKINRVLVTCDRDNIGSAKTIVKNGGIFENEYAQENGNVVQRYWIDTGYYIFITN